MDKIILKDKYFDKFIKVCNKPPKPSKELKNAVKSVLLNKLEPTPHIEPKDKE